MFYCSVIPESLLAKFRQMSCAFFESRLDFKVKNSLKFSGSKGLALLVLESDAFGTCSF